MNPVTTATADYHHPHSDRHIRASVIGAVVLASIGLLLLCVGVGTPAWHIDYLDATGAAVNVSWYTNFFYTCYNPNGTCYSNQNLASSYNGTPQPITYTAQSSVLTPIFGSTDYYVRLRNAAGLSIVGLLFVAIGIVVTILLIIPSLRFVQFDGRLNLIGAFIFAVAALFERAALSEGQRQMNFNGYSANLYQTGHALTIAAVPITAFIAGRLYSYRPVDK